MDESPRRDRLGRQGRQGQGKTLDSGGQFDAGHGESWLEPKDAGGGGGHQSELQSFSEGRKRGTADQVDQGRRQRAWRIERRGERWKMRKRLCCSAAWV